MSAAHLLPEMDADFEEVGDQRRRDRRRSDRRAPRLRLDTLFAATLVNHVMAPEAAHAAVGYDRYGAAVRNGIVVNIRA